MERYKKNLKVEGNKVFSYNTWVATISGSKLLVHGHWSMTTSTHINYIAREYGLTKEDAPKSEREEKDTAGLKGIAMVAMMGEMFGKDKKEKNDWKVRMLKAGLENKGLIMPDDWNTLSEEEKEIRLNGAIKQLT